MVAIKVAPVDDSVHYLHLDYLRESQDSKMRPGFADKLIYKINRSLLKMLGIITFLKLGANDETQSCGDESPSTPPPSHTSTRPSLPSVWARVKYYLRHINNQWLLRVFEAIATRMLSLIHYLFTFHLIVALYYQYSYDFDLMRLIKLRETITTTATTITDQQQANVTSRPEAVAKELLLRNKTQLELELIARMQETKGDLDAVGAPYLHMSIAIETIYLYLVALSFILFNAMNLYYRYVAPLELHVIRESLDYEAEQRHLRQLIEAQAKSFAKSEKLFARIISQCHETSFILQPDHYQTFDWETTTIESSDEADSSGGDLDRVVAHNEHDMGGSGSLSPSLEQMLSSGALVPFNRSLDWFDRRTKFALGFQAFNMIYEMVVFAIVTMVAISERDPNRPATTSDTLLGVSCLGLIVMMGFGLMLFSTYTTIAGLDQIVLINKLIKLVERCIIINLNEFYSRIRSSKCINKSTLAIDIGQHGDTFDCGMGNEEELIVVVPVDSDRGNDKRGSDVGLRALHLNCHGTGYRQQQQQQQLQMRSALPEDDNCYNRNNRQSANKMNTNLLFILMHYKIFIAQANPVVKTLDPMTIVVSILLLLIPIIVRFHLPYLNMFRDTDIRFFAVSLSLTMIVPTNLIILPLCYFQSRCEDLYRALSSLLAHMIEIESEPNARGTYNQHALLMLTKELRNPDLFMDQFKARFASLSGTYTTLVKVHFWYGLIVISIMVDSKYSGQASLELFFNDPLGVF